MTAEGKGADRHGSDGEPADNGQGSRRPGNHDHHNRGDHDGHDGHGDHDDHDGHDHREHHRRMIADFRRRFVVSLVVTLPILVLSPTLQDWFGFSLGIPFRMPILAVLATVVYAYGGWPFLKGMVDELRDRQPGMMTLISVAITVAWGYSAAVALGLPGKVFFWELATLVLVMLAGHWIEMSSVLGASRALDELAELMPSEARLVEEDGSTRTVPVEELSSGDRIRVKPGEKIPADGEVVDGASEIDQSMVTGESKPVEVGEGDEVIAGSVNGSGALTVEVSKTGEDSYLSQVAELVRQAQESRSRSQNLADRAAFWLTVIALSVGALTLAAWILVGRELVFALERSVTVMVITCPHALGLAIPLVVAVSTAIGARSGLLIRDRSSFERARLLDAVVFDKTGTLTEGRFEVSDVVALGEDGEDRVLATAAAVERDSEHSIARGIVERAEADGLDVPEASSFRAIPGRGASAEVEGQTVKVLSPGGLEEEGLSVDDERAASLQDEGKTVVFLVVDGELRGALALDDVIRETARDAIAALKKDGIRCILLTGDNQAVADRVAAELGIDEVRAEVLPDDKADVVRSIRESTGAVAMVGDGVNDAPALAAADLGLAIGAGTDVAVEAADVVLVRDDPADVAKVIALSEKVRSKMIQNLIWATGYNVVAIPLAAGVLAAWGILLSPAVGAVLMSASTVIVAVNARLMSEPESAAESG
ncbi:MAG TPA: copper-translocating P-type ATPase [Candidatus Sulfomarinibacteraceae bacterium]|nr:copper-translocating P-type ATPase [Candidatus Sulfomarinibacteraceae bacterium]